MLQSSSFSTAHSQPFPQRSFLSFASFPCISPLYSVFKTAVPQAIVAFNNSSALHSLNSLLWGRSDRTGLYKGLLAAGSHLVLTHSTTPPRQRSTNTLQLRCTVKIWFSVKLRTVEIEDILDYADQYSVFTSHSSCNIRHKSFSSTYNLDGARMLEDLLHSCRK